MEIENNNTDNKQGKGRRGFIKKASLAAGVSILPASNVWGTVCNASGVSGGSTSPTTSCTVTHWNGGRSPGTWRKFIKHSPSETDKKRIATMVSGMHWQDRFPAHTGGVRKIDFYYPRLKAFIESKHITVPGNGSSIPFKTINIASAVKGNNAIEKHIACTYLNGLFDMNHGLEHHFTGNDGLGAFIEHIWGSYNVGNAYMTESVVSGSYNESKTCTLTTFTNCLKDFI